MCACLQVAVRHVQQLGGSLTEMDPSKAGSLRDRVERVFDLAGAAGQSLGMLWWFDKRLRAEWLGDRWAFVPSGIALDNTATIALSRLGRKAYRHAAAMTVLRQCLQLSPAGTSWLAGERTAAGPWLRQAAERAGAPVVTLAASAGGNTDNRAWCRWWQVCQTSATSNARIVFGPPLSEPAVSRKQLGRVVDRAAIALSRSVISFNRRPGGTIESLWRAYRASPLGKPVDLGTVGQWEWPTWDGPAQRVIRPVIWASLPWTALCHWVRDCCHAWPGESADLWRDRVLLTSCSGDHRSVPTLMRIIEEQRLRGSSRLLPGREPMVSWTCRAPTEWPALRVFRPHLARWDFVPFGIAVSLDEVVSRGAQPVEYTSPGVMRDASPEQRRFMQIQKSARSDADWTAEAEWRSPGDFSLADLPCNSWAVIVPDRAATCRIAQRCGDGNIAFVIAGD